MDFYRSLKINVMAHLCWDNRLESAAIDVAVESGSVTLTGSVPSREARELAEKDTLAVEGVESVQNRLTISRPS